MSPHPLLRRSRNKAAALIIALAFVVLLTGLALAYFSRTTTDRQLAQSSYNDTSADLLARTALDIVVGDFKQEIVNGSTATTVSGTTIYIPTNAAYTVPVHSPTVPPGTTPAIPNLIRQSVRSDAPPGPGIASRASFVSSNDASANGRFISTTRWNKHCLLPPGNGIPAPTIDNPSPIPSFTPPDWVIVTRVGPTPFASWTPSLADANSNNYAVGRYAYAVYDEGGLLDINVAGYPVATPSPPGVVELNNAVGRKGVLALADLTAIVPTPTPNPANMGQFINRIVGTRNYATTGQSNVSNWNYSFSNTPPPVNISSFMQYYLGGASPQPKVGTSRDFGAVNPVLASDGRTDQNFVTRAELIQFFKTAATVTPAPLTDAQSLGMLQYLGTFSRERNKPTLPLTPAWPSTWSKVVLPQRFYLGNLNLVVYPTPTPTPVVTPTPTATPTLTPSVLGLQFVSANTPPPATPTPTPTWGPCDSQVRWKYVGQDTNPAATPRTDISPFPSDLTKLDFFQYINYALFGVTSADSTDMPYTLGIGAALIDQYDAENTLLTGIYYGGPNPAACDPPINACLVYGAEQRSTSTVWYVNPSGCISAPPIPQAFSAPTPTFNSPTRSVGEFGWAYSILNAANNRNTSASPKYVIDFKDPYNPTAGGGAAPNPDPALLDFFTFNSAPLRSGIVSLNTRQPLVLAAILKSAQYLGGASILSQVQAVAAANSIVNSTTTTPAMSRADIARFVGPLVASSTSPFSSASTQDTQDVIARALSEVTQTRTWGLLIDVVAQTGHYKPNAAGLADFVVEGEKRYWLHIAIDRFDGTVVGQQLEEVTE